MATLTLKQASTLFGLANNTLNQASEWGATSMSRYAIAQVCMAVLGILIFFASINYLLIVSSSDHQTKMKPLYSQVEDEKYLVALETIAACVEATKDKLKNVKVYCNDAIAQYKRAMTTMPADRLEEQIRTAAYLSWKIEINHALRLQQQVRASSGPVTFVERVRSWVFTPVGFGLLYLAFFVLPMLLLMFATNKQRAKLLKSNSQPRRLGKMDHLNLIGHRNRPVR